MIILGVDPGLATVGFGVLRSEKNKVELIQYGVITTPVGLPLAMRLTDIEQDFRSLLNEFKPDAVAVEELFFNTNAKTALQVAHARGVILLSAQKFGAQIAGYTPLQVKQAVVGYGRAEKNQVMQMTKKILRLDSIPKPDDAADAIAIALCHARSSTSLLNRGGY